MGENMMIISMFLNQALIKVKKKTKKQKKINFRRQNEEKKIYKNVQSATNDHRNQVDDDDVDRNESVGTSL